MNIENKLPEFIKMVNDKTGPDTIMLHHSAFSNEELDLLGAAVKYACEKGKIVTIIP